MIYELRYFYIVANVLKNYYKQGHKNVCRIFLSYILI